MAQNQPRLAVPSEAIGILATSPDNPASAEILRLLAKKLAREEQELEDTETTLRNMRRQNAEALERKRQDEVLAQAHCDHMTEKRDRAAIVGQRAHNGKYLLLCSRCSKLWGDVGEIPANLQNFIKWEWIGGPQ